MNKSIVNSTAHLITKSSTQVEVVDKKVWFKKDGEIWSYDLIDILSEGKRRKKAHSASPDKIVSNMPGKVTKVFVNVNSLVKAGDPLLVLEAMKMEYTLKADIHAEVEKLNVAVGDQVTIGQLLVQLKAGTTA